MEDQTPTLSSRLSAVLDNSPHCETRVSKAWMFDSNIVYVICKDNADITLEDAIEDMAASEMMRKNIVEWAIVIDMKNVNSISKEAREYYSKYQDETQHNVGVALIAKSVFTRVIANFFIGFEKHSSPFKVFNSEELALEWIIEKFPQNK